MELFSVILFFAVTVAHGSNILFILPYPAPSHFYCFYPLMEKLIERGHNVTVIGSVNPMNENITLVQLHGSQKFFPPSFGRLRSESRFGNMITTLDIGTTFVKQAFYHENFQKFMNNDEQHFDVVLVELYYCDAYLAVARKFNAPIIGLVPQFLPAVYSWLTKNPISFSYIPNMYLPYSNEMGFLQRVSNAIFGMVHVLAYEFHYFFVNQDVINKHFPYLSDHQKNLRTMLEDISLTLINSHYSVGYPRPLLPNVVEVAGIHFKPTKPLPPNIQNFLDNASHGAVYISFGSMVELDVIEKWGQVIINVFKKLPLKIIWKWNSTMIANVPKNFFMQTWLPQNEILRHPNCKLFISHGGVHSLIEAVDAAVPIIGVPFFSDQHLNIGIAEKLGIGIGLKDVVENELEEAVRNILENPEYQDNASKRSRLFRDRMTDPVSTAVFWVEHIIRNKGAPYLKSGVSKLSWYQYLMLDLIAFFIVSLIIVGIVFKFVVKYFCTYCGQIKNLLIRLIRDFLNDKKKIQ